LKGPEDENSLNGFKQSQQNSMDGAQDKVMHVDTQRDEFNDSDINML